MFNCSAVSNHTDTTLNLFERVAYTLVFFVGLVFNVTALCIFCRIKHWTDTHIYMLNLLGADFLAIIFLPFRIFETFCSLDKTKLCTFLLCIHFSNMYCSIFTITAISVHRFIAIRFPFLGRAQVTKRNVIAVSVCILIWTIVTIICAVFHGNLLPDHLETCYDRKLKDKLESSFFFLLEIIGYLVPIAIVTFCSIQTIYILLKSIKRVEESERVKRKAIAAVISANMFTFVICFTPVHVAFLLQYLSKDDRNHVLHVFLDVAEWIATTNCCLDSIGYYFLLKRVSKSHANNSQT